MEHESSGPVGLPYPAEKVKQTGHPWEQPAEVPQPTTPQSDLRAVPVGGHGALAGTSWEQRAQQRTPFRRLVAVEYRKLVGTTSEIVQLAVATALLVALTALPAFLVNQGAPETPPFQLFGLVLAGHLAPVALYAVVLRSLSGEWYYRAVELTLLYQPSRLRAAAAQLAVVGSLWPVIAVLQFVIYLPAKPALYSAPLWVFAVALLTGLITLLVALAVMLLIRNPTGGALVFGVLSVLYLARVQNPLVLRFVDPWQPASLFAGIVAEPIPALTSAALLLVVLALGVLRALRRRFDTP